MVLSPLAHIDLQDWKRGENKGGETEATCNVEGGLRFPKRSAKRDIDCSRVNFREIYFFSSGLDELVKSPKSAFPVIPAKAGIQSFQWFLDAGSSPA